MKADATAAVLVSPDCHTPVSRIVMRADRRRDERDDEHFDDRVEALLHRLRALRGAVGDGGGAVARLVRVDASRDAVAHGDQDAEVLRPRPTEIENARSKIRLTTEGMRDTFIAITISPPTR